MKSVRIFISSPDDVEEERALTKRAVGRLRVEFAGRAEIELLYWEDEPLTAATNFQRQLPSAKEADIVVTILWSKLGTPLPTDRLRPDGTRYESGTVYEFEDAMASAADTGSPKVLFYQRVSPVVVALDATDLAARRERQKELQAYVTRWFGADEQGALNRAFRTYEEPAAFAQVVEEHLRRQVERLLPDSPESLRAAATWKGSPFRGLQAFEYEHAAIFCGRENAGGQVVHALKAQANEGRAFVLVVGMSGSGKSSLIRAGVIPALERIELRDGRRLRRALFRPGESPGDLIKGVVGALCASEALPELLEDAALDEPFADYAVNKPAAAAFHLHKTLRARSEHLVLLLDQLEEIFSLPEINAEKRGAFLEFIEHLADKGPVWVIGTLRNDFCAQAFENPIIAGLKFGQGQIDLQPPTPTEIGHMIRTPARAAGLHFEKDAGQSLDDVIHDEAVQYARALPLLEFTLEQLYADAHADRVLKFSTYRRFHGMRGSIAGKAEATFSELSADSQAALGRVLASMSMVDPDNPKRIARRRLSRAAFAADANSLALIDAFVAARLFISEGDELDHHSIEVAHEALLSEWERARTWSEENLEFIKIRNRVSAAAEIWDEEKKDPDRLAFEGTPLNDVRALQERASRQEIQLDPAEGEFVAASVARFTKRVRRRRIALASFATLACVATAFAIFAFLAQRRALQESRTADASINFLTGMFDKMQPRFAKGQDVTVRQVMEQSNRTVREQLAGKDNRAILARVQRAVGQVYTATGDSDEAIVLLTEVLKSQESMGADEKELSAAHLALGDANYLSGLTLEAKSEYLEALKLIDATGRDDSELLADVLLGLAESETVDIDASDKFAKEAVEVYTRVFGPKDSRVIRARLEIAKLYIDGGASEDAIPLLTELRTDLLKTTSADSPDVAEIDDTLGVAYWETQDSAKAVSQFTAALKTFEKVYGADDPDVANTLHSRGRVQLEQCAFDAAEQDLSESLRIQSVSMKLPRPLGALANYNMGLLKLWRQSSDAEKYFADSLEIAKNNLAETQEKVAKRMKLPKLTQEQLEAAAEKKILVAKASASIGMAEVQIAKDDITGAGKSLEESKRLLIVTGHPEDHWRFGIWKTTHAWLIAKTEKPDIAAARSELKESMGILMGRWPGGSLFSAVALERLGELHEPEIDKSWVGCPAESLSAEAH